MSEELRIALEAVVALILVYSVVFITKKPLEKLLRKFLRRRDQPDTLITLPEDPAEIIKRLSSVSDERNLVEKLYPLIAAKAGQQFAPRGLLLMMVLTVEDVGNQYPPGFKSIMQLFIPRWIDVLVDNKDVAGTVKALLKDAQEEVKRQSIANRKEPEGPIEDDQLYFAVRKIADIFFEEIERFDKENLISIEKRDDGVNPFYNQTESGLFVEYYYGHPSKIWTPWGYFQFTGSVSYRGDAPWKEILEAFLQRLGATLFIPEQRKSYGMVGPVYAIHKVDDLDLPESKVRENQNFLEYNVSKKAWEAMEKRQQSIAV